MKRWFFAISIFLAGLLLGVYFSRPASVWAQTKTQTQAQTQANAQAPTKTVVQAFTVETDQAFGGPRTPPTKVSGKIVGFACAQSHCFVLTQK